MDEVKEIALKLDTLCTPTPEKDGVFKESCQLLREKDARSAVVGSAGKRCAKLLNVMSIIEESAKGESQGEPATAAHLKQAFYFLWRTAMNILIDPKREEFKTFALYQAPFVYYISKLSQPLFLLRKLGYTGQKDAAVFYLKDDLETDRHELARWAAEFLIAEQLLGLLEDVHKDCGCSLEEALEVWRSKPGSAEEIKRELQRIREERERQERERQERERREREQQEKEVQERMRQERARKEKEEEEERQLAEHLRLERDRQARQEEHEKQMRLLQLRAHAATGSVWPSHFYGQQTSGSQEGMGASQYNDYSVAVVDTYDDYADEEEQVNMYDADSDPPPVDTPASTQGRDPSAGYNQVPPGITQQNSCYTYSDLHQPHKASGTSNSQTNRMNFGQSDAAATNVFTTPGHNISSSFLGFEQQTEDKLSMIANLDNASSNSGSQVMSTGLPSSSLPLDRRAASPSSSVPVDRHATLPSSSLPLAHMPSQQIDPHVRHSSTGEDPGDLVSLLGKPGHREHAVDTLSSSSKEEVWQKADRDGYGDRDKVLSSYQSDPTVLSSDMAMSRAGPLLGMGGRMNSAPVQSNNMPVGVATAHAVRRESTGSLNDSRMQHDPNTDGANQLAGTPGLNKESGRYSPTTAALQQTSKHAHLEEEVHAPVSTPQHGNAPPMHALEAIGNLQHGKSACTAVPVPPLTNNGVMTSNARALEAVGAETTLSATLQHSSLADAGSLVSVITSPDPKEPELAASYDLLSDSEEAKQAVSTNSREQTSATSSTDHSDPKASEKANPTGKAEQEQFPTTDTTAAHSLGNAHAFDSLTKSTKEELSKEEGTSHKINTRGPRAKVFTMSAEQHLKCMLCRDGLAAVMCSNCHLAVDEECYGSALSSRCIGVNEHHFTSLDREKRFTSSAPDEESNHGPAANMIREEQAPTGSYEVVSHGEDLQTKALSLPEEQYTGNDGITCSCCWFVNKPNTTHCIICKEILVVHV